jgi:hypothetical protein
MIFNFLNISLRLYKLRNLKIKWKKNILRLYNLFLYLILYFFYKFSNFVIEKFIILLFLDIDFKSNFKNIRKFIYL